MKYTTTVADYLTWRGDIPFSVDPFNEVDNLLMAELCFLDFSGIVPADFSAPVFLPDAMRRGLLRYDGDDSV